MQENELLDELCAQIGPVEDTDALIVEGALPVPVMVFLNLVLMKLRAYGCEHKDALVAQANTYIDKYVKSAFVAGMMKAALETAVAAICG
jgi:hypothetical protein